MAVTRRVCDRVNITGLWQRNYYDHVIRDEEEHQKIHLYIEANPANWLDDQENPERIGR